MNSFNGIMNGFNNNNLDNLRSVSKLLQDQILLLIKYRRTFQSRVSEDSVNRWFIDIFKKYGECKTHLENGSDAMFYIFNYCIKSCPNCTRKVFEGLQAERVVSVLLSGQTCTIDQPGKVKALFSHYYTYYFRDWYYQRFELPKNISTIMQELREIKAIITKDKLTTAQQIARITDRFDLYATTFDKNPIPESSSQVSTELEDTPIIGLDGLDGLDGLIEESKSSS